ncbi:aminopeptidase N [Ischnura elegans]|uniref:aminopeptidase N n=1 Tax=Ischnura elegans TaxID=197161 RepID=UPI001ED890E4|nr:aminopeptidase N [Ischnura elegans]
MKNPRGGYGRLCTALLVITLALTFDGAESRCTSGCKQLPKKEKRSVDFRASNQRLEDSRLPKTVVPYSYRLHLRPSLEDTNFHGRVWIGFTVTEPTDTITLHARKLQIETTSVSVTKVVGSSNNITSDFQARLLEYEKEHEFYIIRLKPGARGKYLEPGNKYEVHLSFYGAHTRTGVSRLDGFFRETYVDQKTKEKRWYAATQMSPANARQVFPCFDEPSLKATFEVSVARPSHLSALSNMPIKTTEVMVERPGWYWDHFEKTPPMSPCSVAVLVSDLTPRHDEQALSGQHRRRNGASPAHSTPDYPRPQQPGSATVTVWASQGVGQAETATAAAVAPRVLSFFEAYLDTPFPLPKLDLIALPAYTASVPAHNWGLVFFRESDLLADNAGSEKWVTSRVAGELAYQWVGGFVTPAWWTDAWINKALANYMTSVAVDELQSRQDQAPSQRSPSSLIYSLYYEYSKHSPYSRIMPIKDLVSAEKGEMVIRMLNNTLSEDTFRAALKDFFTERQFSTFVQDDLWDTITRRAHIDGTLPEDATVKDIADSWIDKDRFPVVTITRNYKAGTADIEQRMFIRTKTIQPGGGARGESFDSDGGAAGDDHHQQQLMQQQNSQQRPLWWVPIVMATQEKMNFGETTPITWMKPTERRIALEGEDAREALPGPESFLVVNPEEIGFFFVNYDRRNWRLLADFLQGPRGLDSVPEVTRAKLVHDALNLALGDELAFDVALNVTRFLRRERSMAPWKPAFYIMDFLSRQLDGTMAGKKFADYVVRLVSPLYEELMSADRRQGSEDDLNMADFTPGWKARLRASARNALCLAGHPPCIAASKAQFDTWMEQGVPIPVQSLCPVFGWGTRKEWEYGLDRVLKFNDAQQPRYGRVYLLKTLASCTRDPELIERLLKAGLHDRNVFTDEELRLILSMMTSTYNGHHTLFKYLRDNWDSLKSSFERKTQMWNSLISFATGAFKTQHGHDMVHDFYKKHKGEFGSAEVIIIQSLKKIKSEAKWSERNLPIIESWLDSYLKTN